MGVSNIDRSVDAYWGVRSSTAASLLAKSGGDEQHCRISRYRLPDLQQDPNADLRRRGPDALVRPDPTADIGAWLSDSHLCNFSRIELSPNSTSRATDQWKPSMKSVISRMKG